MKSTVLLISLSLIIAGCMAPRYETYEPVASDAMDLNLRLTLTDRSEIELRHALVAEDHVTGTARGGRRVTIAMNQIRAIEQSTGSTFDAASVAGALLLAGGLFFLILVGIGETSPGHF